MNIPIKNCIARAVRLWTLKSLSVAILPLAFAIHLMLPGPAQAQQNLCSIAQGTIDAGNTFTEDTTGSDFKITCKGAATSNIEADTFKALLDEQSGYVESQSKVIIDGSGVTGTNIGVSIVSAAEKMILVGTIANDDTITGDSVVSVSEDPGTDGVAYDVNVESRATISSEGANRIGLQLDVTDGDADATIENSGSISTKGTNAHGLSAWVDPGAASARSVLSVANSGSITTEGANADGISAGAAAGANKASRVSVDNSGTITTSGTGATGLSAYLQLNDAATDANSANASGLVSVTNSGTITVNGDGSGSGFATGLEAVYRPSMANTPVQIVNSGNVMIEHSGTITASGNRVKGIYALTHGPGNVDIAVSGTISAGHQGPPEAQSDESDMESDTVAAAVSKKFGIGIHAKAHTSNTDVTEENPLADPTDDIDVMIVVTGSGASITAYGAPGDDGSTSDFDESKGIAILAETGASTGHSRVQISNGAKVSATGGNDTSDGYAVMFKGGSGTLDINGGNLVGNILFTGNDDVLNIDNTGSIAGDVDFRGGDDTLNIDLGDGQRFQINGDITGLTTLNKKGAGYARFGGDVTFQGSAVNLEDGALVIAGRMNLGSGVVTVHKAGRIVFEVGSGGSTGSISAGTMHFEGIDAGDVSVYAQLNDGLTDEEVTAARSGLTSKSHELLSVGTITSGTTDSSAPVSSLSIKTVQADGETASVGSIAYAGGVGTAAFSKDSVDQIAKLNPGPPAPVSSGGGDSDDSNAKLGLSLLAVLLAFYWTDNLFGSSFADDYSFDTPQSAYIASVDERGMLTVRDTDNQPFQVWIRTGQHDAMQTAGVESAGVSGTEVGVSLYRSDDFYIEASSAQNVAAEVSALNLAAQGEVYSLSGGWQNERYFAGLRLSQGDFDTDSILDNPVVNSALVSESEVRHSQAQFTAGARWSAGPLLFTPSASVQVGTFEHSAHRVEGAALSAQVPAFSQQYSALRLGLKMSAGEWLRFSGDAKWKPHLQLDQIHTDSTSAGDVALHQVDRLGALSFSSPAAVQAMPKVVNALSFGASVKASKSNHGEWRLGYAGLEADGEYYHAAVLGYQMRF